MKANYLYISAVAALALTSCANDDYLGSNSEEASGQKAIQFTGAAKAVTRSTTGDVEKLNGQFKVYGIKTVSDVAKDVFVNYSVWDADANSTVTNTNGWEYAAEASDTEEHGTGKIKVTGNDQTVKYWDYSASDYRFVAGSPVDAFTYTLDTDGNIVSATYDASKAVYIADPVLVSKSDFGNPVTFVFKSPSTKVRVGVYETIPGYDISAIKFYTQDGKTTSDKVILQSNTENYFNGSFSGNGVITYDWTITADHPKPSYTLSSSAAGDASQNWYGGKLDGVKAESSSATVDDLFGEGGGTNGYFSVTPCTKDAAPIFIKCDYTLKSNDGRSDETIDVKGATAAIPAAYCKWAQNTQYTYLFKISDNTNGYTGGYKDDPDHPGTLIPNGPEGLYPITFEASVTEGGEDEGTITTVATPSITTYQEGSVTANGIEYVANDKSIDIKVVAADGSTLNGGINIFKLTDVKTEAELVLNAPTSSNATFCIAFSNTNGVGYIDADEYGAGYYAIQYVVSDAVTYTQTEIDDAKAIVDASGYVAGTNPEAEAVAAKTTSDVKTPAVYAYKVVYVKAAA